MLKRVVKSIYYKLKYSSKKVYIGKKNNISLSTKFEGYNKILNNVNLDNVEIGYGTYIGNNNTFYNTRIGRYCSIGNNIKTIVATHPTNKFVSTHPAFYSIKKQAGFTYVSEDLFEEIKYIDKERKTSIIIGNDVWIGDNVIILGGVKIGDGAIIGANSFVNKDVEPYAVQVGIPAKKIKYRFNEDEIEYLLKFKWWNKEINWLKENALKFNNIKKFIGDNDGTNNDCSNSI